MAKETTEEKRKSPDKEIGAMSRIKRTLDDLSPEERQRVISWMYDKFNPPIEYTFPDPKETKFA